MPYVVPISPLCSPDHTPIPLSMPPSSPAPVPIPSFIPFPSVSPTSPKLASTSYSHHLYQNGDLFHRHLYSSFSLPLPDENLQTDASYVYPPPAPPLLMSTSTISSSPPNLHTRIHEKHITSHNAAASSSQSPPPPLPSSSSSNSLRPVRRTMSAPQVDVRDVSRFGQFENKAGRGLPHIPRRIANVKSKLMKREEVAKGSPDVGGGGGVNGEESKGETLQNGNAPHAPVNKPRSRFVLGSEESGSGSDESSGVAREEDVPLFPSIKAEDDNAIELIAKPTTPSALESPASLHEEDTTLLPDPDGVRSGMHSDSGSECATPTPVSIARGRRAREKLLEASAVHLRDGERAPMRPSRSSTSSGSSTSVARSCSPSIRDVEEPARAAAGFTASSIPGIAPRPRRGRGAKALRHRSGVNIIEKQVKVAAAPSKTNETSTVAFPLSGPPSPDIPNAVVVTSPTPSPPQLSAVKGFAGKRSNADALHLDFPKATSSNKHVHTNDKKQNEHGHHKGVSFIPHSASYSPPAHVPKILAATVSAPAMPSVPLSAPPAESSQMDLSRTLPLIRKKSGEVLKSSLKSRSSSASGRHRPTFSLSDLSNMTLSPSMSAPTTPSILTADGVPDSMQSATVKMVHFDAQLEHVKLFLAEQKPAAVSRDGSPTLDDTTSGGEGESSAAEWGDAYNFSGFTFPPRGRKRLTSGASSEEEVAVRKVLMMRVLNMPASGGRKGSMDVWLEGLHLSDDATNVQGTVRVRNIAFEKSVAVRFTFDGWQTTSEVLAKWVESCSPTLVSNEPLVPPSVPGPASSASVSAQKSTASIKIPAFDRFSFSIRLTDILLRIDEKTLVLAIRYNAGGREAWDNNSGQNYRAVFEKRAPSSLLLSGSSAIINGIRTDTSQNGSDGTEDKDEKGGNALGLSLQNALENVVSGNGTGAVKNIETKEKDKQGHPSTSATGKKSAGSLASRYDLGASLKNPVAWRPPLDHSLTWAGHGYGRDVHPRAFMSSTNTQPSVPRPAKKSEYPIPKSRAYASHRIVFESSNLATGSPRDSDREALDATFIDKLHRPGFGYSSSEYDAESIRAPLPRRVSNTSSVSSSSSSSSSATTAHKDIDKASRNHHRSYFDSWAASYPNNDGSAFGNTRITPPGTPRTLREHRSLSDADVLASTSHASSRTNTPATEFPPASSPGGRYHSFPPMSSSPGSPRMTGALVASPRVWTDVPQSVRSPEARDSDLSTPSYASSSPSLTPTDLPVAFPILHTSHRVPDDSPMDSTSYSLFLNKFCFYTGHEALLDIPVDIRRSYSASSVEELLSSPSQSSAESFPFFKTPRAGTPSPRSTTPTPFSMSIGPGAGSGSIKPTSAAFLGPESPHATPVLG